MLWLLAYSFWIVVKFQVNCEAFIQIDVKLWSIISSLQIETRPLELNSNLMLGVSFAKALLSGSKLINESAMAYNELDKFIIVLEELEDRFHQEHFGIESGGKKCGLKFILKLFKKTNYIRSCQTHD